MYKIVLSNSIPNRAEPLRTGRPIHDHTIPNLAIVSVNNSDCIALNAIILRDALLNSKELLKEIVGIDIKDAFASDPKPENPTPQPEPTKKTKAKPKVEKETKDSEEAGLWE